APLARLSADSCIKRCFSSSDVSLASFRKKTLSSEPFQRLAPSDNLIEHRVDGLRLLRAGLENAEVLEVSEEGYTNLSAHVGDHQFAHHQTQTFNRANSRCAPITDEPDGLVVPLFEEEIDRVLERTGRAVVVFGCHKHKAIE